MNFEKYGILNNEGKEVLPTQYTDITNLGENSNEGFIVANEEKKYGIVSYSNTVILEPKYDEISKIHGNDMYVGKQVLVNKEGTQSLSTGFDEIKQILKNTENGVIYTKNNKYGIMTYEGNDKIAAQYDELKEAKTGLFVAKKDGKYGIIDIDNTTKIEFNYNSMVYNEKADIYIGEKQDYTNDIIDNTFAIRQSGILIQIDNEKGYFELRQGEEYKYYNFKFEEQDVKDIQVTNTLFKSKKDGKYGFIDKDGKVVVEYEYDDVTDQNNFGYAGIKKDGKWGVVDVKGNVILTPTYNLDDYLKIDFIGKWHLGKDINMNYYNQL